MSFTRRIEPFICEHCGTHSTSNGYTNHCPACLWSKHVDIDPGDRASLCNGMMQPFASRYGRDGYSVYHTCQTCGAVKKNRASSSDNLQLLILLGKNPLP